MVLLDPDGEPAAAVVIIGSRREGHFASGVTPTQIAGGSRLDASRIPMRRRIFQRAGSLKATLIQLSVMSMSSLYALSVRSQFTILAL